MFEADLKEIGSNLRQFIEEQKASKELTEKHQFEEAERLMKEAERALERYKKARK